MTILEKIAEAKKSGTKVFDIKNEKLHILPVELWELTELEELIIDGNDLVDLPEEVGQLTNLKSLSLSENDLMSLLQDERSNPEEVLEVYNDGKLKKDFISKAISTLNQREQTIIKLRKLKEKSITLDELGKMLKISKERVRQIETKALEKLKLTILEISQQNKEFFI